MADDVVFQSTTPATPAANERVSAEEVTTLNGGAVTAAKVQRIAAAIRTADGTAIDLPGDATNGLDVDVTRVVPGTGATHLGKAEDAAHTSGDTGVMALAVRKDSATALAGTDGDYAPLEVDANGRLHVVASAGLAGDVAHDAADSGAPVKAGGKARTANPTNVAAGDRSQLYTDVSGRLITREGQPRDLILYEYTNVTGTSEANISAAGGAGVYKDLVAITISSNNDLGPYIMTGVIRSVTSGPRAAVFCLSHEQPSVCLAFPRPLPQATANSQWVIAVLFGGGVNVDVCAVFEVNTA